MAGPLMDIAWIVVELYRKGGPKFIVVFFHPDWL
jgi:hypothetical protein